MEFRALGDLQVVAEGQALALGSHQQRVVLAVLVLSAGEVVSSDRLVEALWPERPPATAAKTVQVYISRLRKTLNGAHAGTSASEGWIATVDHGYVLRVDPGQVDVGAFERLLERGRVAFADREFDAAATALTRALGLWRGAPLADFTFDAFAAGEIARLQELRLEALEIRIDADLALGRHAALVAELEALTTEHPLRERLRAARMLALYRCGREPEALALYRETRQMLVDELGMEPSPALRELHDAILRQDPALQPAAAPRPPPSTGSDAPERRRRRAAVAIAVLGLVGGVAGGDRAARPQRRAAPGRQRVGQRGGGDRPGAQRRGASDRGRRAARRHLRRRRRHLGGQPRRQLGLADRPAVRDGEAHVLHRRGGHRRAGDERRTRCGRWTTRARPSRRSIPPSATRVARSPSDGRLGARVPAAPSAVAAAGGSVWAATGNATVVQLDARSGRVETTIAVGNEPAAIAASDGGAWVADDADNTVTRIDAGGVATGPLPVGKGASGIAVGAGAVWVANTLDDTVTRIDPATGETKATIPVGAGPRGLAVGLGAVWVADSRGADVSRIDPRTDRVQTIPVGGSPEGVAVDAGRVWVTVQASSPPPGRPVAGGTLRIVQQNDFGSTDPAILYSFGDSAHQLEYATCAKLLDYPDRPAPQGTRLVPEVAAALPEDLARRAHLHVHAPAGLPILAALERASDRARLPTRDRALPQPSRAVAVDRHGRHRRRQRLPGGQNDTPGGDQRHRQHPDHPSRTRLAQPARTNRHAVLLRRSAKHADSLRRPQAVHPLRRPVLHRVPHARLRARATTQPQLPRAAPTPLRRDRLPLRCDADARRRARRGRARRLRRRRARPAAVARRRVADGRHGLQRGYGPHSPAARSGRQRYFVNRNLASVYLLLNARRSLFASARMRRAVNFAVDRPALARNALAGFSSVPTDQYLPPGTPGFRDADIYPLGGPDPRPRPEPGRRSPADTR